MIVIDASAAIELLLGTKIGAAVETRLFSAPEELHAPHLVDVEVAHVIRRWLLRGLIDEARARSALNDLRVLPVIRYGHEILLPRIWQLRNNLSAYDAAYVALAELLDVPLLTCDRRLATASGHGARVEAF